MDKNKMLLKEYQELMKAYRSCKTFKPTQNRNILETLVGVNIKNEITTFNKNQTIDRMGLLEKLFRR